MSGNILSRYKNSDVVTIEKLEKVWQSFKCIFEEENDKEEPFSHKQKEALRDILRSKQGFAIALTSKILRLGDPSRFVIEDQVFKKYLSFDDHTLKGSCEDYQRFLKSLFDFKKVYECHCKRKPLSIGDLEFAIYHITKMLKEKIAERDKNNMSKKTCRGTK